MKRLIIALALLMPVEAMARDWVTPYGGLVRNFVPSDLAERVFTKGKVVAHMGEYPTDFLLISFQSQLFKCSTWDDRQFGCQGMRAASPAAIMRPVRKPE